MKTIISSEKELNKVAEYLNQTLPKNAIIFLIGDLASGKTTLTKAIAKSKGIDSEVTSPTFSLQQCYGDDFFHYDLYRIDYSEFMELGLFEEFDRDGWHLVEWGDDRLKEFLLDAGYNLYTIFITPSDKKRKYEIEKN
jgi:tRNA threonylcarbamoyladenosine biosynthesis protein TsaE